MPGFVDPPQAHPGEIASPSSVVDIRSFSPKQVNEIAGNAVSAHEAAAHAGVVNIKALGADPTGVDDCSSTIQQVVDAINSAFVATGNGGTIYMPKGRYKIAADVQWRSGVSVVGDGMAVSKIIPVGAATPFRFISDGSVVLDDCNFSDFSIDGADQAGSSATDYTVKAFYLQHIRNCHWRRVSIANIWATGFGVDYLRGVSFIDCHATNCGRGVNEMDGAGAGFGFATGYYPREETSIIACTSRDNKSNGYFTEFKKGFAYWPTGFIMSHCVATGNRNGWNDSGSTGAMVSNCDFSDNRFAGVSMPPTAGNARSGWGGTVRGCRIRGNGAIGGRGGVYIGAEVRDYNFVDNDITDNINTGVRFSGTVEHSGITFSGGRITGHSRAGVLALNPTLMRDLTIRGVQVYDNGAGGTDRRSGIVIECPTVNLRIIGADAKNTVASTSQQIGIHLRGNFESTSPWIEGCDLRGNANLDMIINHTVSDVSLIRNNVAAPSPLIGDSFNRPASGNIGNTDHGSLGPLAWATSGTAWSITSTEDVLPNTGTGRTEITVDAGVSDVRVGAYLVQLSSATASGGVVCRFVDGDNLIRFGPRSNGNYALFKEVAGTVTVVQAVDDVSSEAGDFVEIAADGTTIKGFVNGVEVATATIEDHASATRVGLASESAGENRLRWDSFRATAIA